MSIINYTADKQGNLSLDHISFEGKTWATDYQNASPFPHIVFDNFFQKSHRNIISKFPLKISKIILMIKTKQKKNFQS